jgi:hypothetical protein
MRRAHDPSGLRRRRHRLRRKAQQQGSDAGSLRGQCEFAAGDEIELTRLPPDLQHDRAKRIAGQRVGGGPQRGIDIGGAHGHDKTRIEAEFGQSVHRQRARFNFRKILPHPDQRPARRDASCEAGDEPGRRRALPSLGKHFMHRRHRKTAPQRRIGARMAERDFVERVRIGKRSLDTLDAAAQTRKRACACGAHAPLPRKIVGVLV